MKAIALHVEQPGLHAIELPEPKVERADHVKVRIIRVGIDGTDKSLWKHHLVDVARGEEHLVLGHEGYGQVVEVGKGVKRLAVGDRVVMTVRRPCGICQPCKQGQSDMCMTGLYTERGIHKDQGFLTETIVEREEHLVKVPAGIEDLAVWAEPFSILEKGMQQFQLQFQRLPWGCEHKDHYHDDYWGPCKKGLVFGFGPIGFTALALMALQGMKLYVLEKKDEDSLKVKLLKAMGAEYIDSRRINYEKLFESVGPFDVIVEATGASKDAFELIPAMNRDAIYLFTGVPRVSKEKVSLDADTIVRHIVRLNQMIIGTVNGNRGHFEAALKDLVKLKKKFPKIMEQSITHRFSLDQYQDAFEMIGHPESMKVVFEIGEEEV